MELNFNFTQENYTDYNARDYFKSLGCKEVNFTPKYAPETEDNEVAAILIHVSGSMPNGKRLNADLWPQKDFTEADLKKFFGTMKVKDKDGKEVEEIDVKNPIINLEDIGMRYGYAKVVDKETGEESIKVSRPRWIDYTVDGKVKTLSGDRRKRYGE